MWAAIFLSYNATSIWVTININIYILYFQICYNITRGKSTCFNWPLNCSKTVYIYWMICNTWIWKYLVMHHFLPKISVLTNHKSLFIVVFKLYFFNEWDCSFDLALYSLQLCNCQTQLKNIKPSHFLCGY